MVSPHPLRILMHVTSPNSHHLKRYAYLLIRDKLKYTTRVIKAAPNSHHIKPHAYFLYLNTFYRNAMF